jgi:Tfp pilus assembly protein PilN
VPKQRVVIELSPSRLEVALIRGKAIVARRAERFLLPTFSDQWSAALASIKPRLTRLVSDLGAQGALATILYSAPSATTGTFSCPLSAGRAQAQRAASLALGEAAGIPLQGNPHDLEERFTDQTDESGGEPPLVHFLGVADTDTSSQALADLASDAGLVPDRLVPLDAAAIAAVIERAAAEASGQGVTIVLHVGDHASVVGAVSKGRLRFVRQIGVGCEMFVEALAARMGGAGGEEYPAAARDVLFQAGIPTRDQQIDAGGLSAGMILPILQPTLQRCVLEIRQSLRFGLEESQRTGARLIGLGPGAAVPRFLEVIAEQAALVRQPGDAPATQTGTIDTWAALTPPNVNLLPGSLSTQRLTRRLRRGVWIGTAAAAAVLAGDWWLSSRELSQRQQVVEQLKTRLQAARPMMDLEAKLVAAQGSVAGARQRIAARMGAAADWDAALAMLASATPPTIKLDEIRCAMDNGKPVCSLLGRAPMSGSDSSLNAYVDALSAVPIVKACHLGSTQRSESSGGTMQTFEMTLTLVEFPAEGFGVGRLVSGVPDDKETP